MVITDKELIDVTTDIEIIQGLDAVNFLSTKQYNIGDSISIFNSSSDLLFSREIVKVEEEIQDSDNKVYKYTGSSTFAKMKKDIDYLPTSGQTNKDIILDILQNTLGISDVDDTLYTSSLAFQGNRPFGVEFGAFESYNAMNLIFNLLAIDNMVLTLKNNGGIKFVENNRTNNQSVEKVADLVRETNSNNLYTGIKIYDSELPTGPSSLIVEKGDGSNSYVSLFFNGSATTQATNFANNLVDNFNVPVDSISFRSNQNLELGDAFNVNFPSLGITADYMIERKQVRYENGAILYTYRAFKKNQMIQFFHNKSALDSVFRYSNSKRPSSNITLTEGITDISDDGTNVRTLALDKYSVVLEGGIPTVRIYFTKGIKSSFNPTDFQLYF